MNGKPMRVDIDAARINNYYPAEMGSFADAGPAMVACAAELGLALASVIWENAGLRQIPGDMASRGIARVGVGGIDPDFGAPAADRAAMIVYHELRS